MAVVCMVNSTFHGHVNQTNWAEVQKYSEPCKPTDESFVHAGYKAVLHVYIFNNMLLGSQMICKTKI